jgi:hypothetical protein
VQHLFNSLIDSESTGCISYYDTGMLIINYITIYKVIMVGSHFFRFFSRDRTSQLTEHDMFPSFRFNKRNMIAN